MNNISTYLFSLNKEFYLYDFNMKIIMQINQQLYNDLLKYIKKGKINSDNYIIHKLLKNGFFRENKIAAQMNEINIAYLSFAPTYQCNFRCKYCFGEYGNKYNGILRSFTESSLKNILDYFFFVAFPNYERYRLDFVSGGEPLLGFNIIKATIQYIEENIIPKGKKVSMWLCTNGALLTNEIIEFLSEHNVSIGISIDGTKEMNDMYRIDAFGNGTYDQICKGISLVHNNKNATLKFKNLWGLCTATEENCDFVSILQHMKLLNFNNVQIRLIRSEKKYNISKILSEYDKLADFLLNSYFSNQLQFLYMILNDNDQFGKVLKRIILDQILFNRCNAGINKITICPDGSIYPCDSFVGLKQFQIGTVSNTNNIKNIYKNINVNTIKKCSKCSINYLCGGDCYYNSFMKTGAQTIPDEEFCKIQKHIIELCLMIRYKMETSDSERFKQLRKFVGGKDDYTKIFG